MEYNDAPYIQAVSSFAVPGLFSNFHSAATLLRMARYELRVDLIDNRDAVVNAFYLMLNEIEAHMKISMKKDLIEKKRFIIEVEGLDGSGKTTLVTKLTEALARLFPNATAIATKTPSLSCCRVCNG